MKQDTLEWPWELQSSTLSDSWSSKSQKHDLHVQTVPSTDKDFQQQGPQKRQHEPFSVKPLTMLTYELKARENHTTSRKCCWRDLDMTNLSRFKRTLDWYQSWALVILKKSQPLFNWSTALLLVLFWWILLWLWFDWATSSLHFLLRQQFFHHQSDC